MAVGTRKTRLVEAVNLYEGAKVNINHPKGHPLSPRDYQDRLGVVRSVEFRRGEGLFGDLHFNPKHALSEQLVWDAEHAPQNVGMSHNVLARTKRQGEETVVEAITKVQSIDLVADPATTSGLYEHAESPELSVKRQEPENGGPGAALDSPLLTLDTLTLEQIRRHRPELICELEREYESQLEQLRNRVDKMIAKEQASQRRERAVQLLQEYELPLPGKTGNSGNEIVSDQFMQSLMKAPDEKSMQLLVEERAKLVRSASRWNGGRRSNDLRPRSRDQLSLTTALGSRTQTAAEFAAGLRSA